MAYTFVGYQIVDQHASVATSVTVDLSTLIGGTIAAGDVAFVTPWSFGAGFPRISDWTSAGWSAMGINGRIPGTWVFQSVMTKALLGSETTVTFTQFDTSKLATEGALVAVYRGFNDSIGYNNDEDPSNPANLSPPQQAANPTDVTCTVGSVANALGGIRQIILYLYLDYQGSGTIVETADPALTKRFSTIDTGASLYLSWYDEPWESAANLPSRAVSTHWSSGTAAHFGRLSRMWSLADQSIVGDTSGAGDAWAWVG